MESEPKVEETNSAEWDDRRKILKVTSTFIDEVVNSTTTNIYKGKEVRNFLLHNIKSKKNSQAIVNETEKFIQESKDTEVKMKKILEKLTPEQEKLIEDLRVVGTYAKLDKMKQTREQQEEYLKNTKAGMKKDNPFLEELLRKCKSVDLK